MSELGDRNPRQVAMNQTQTGFGIDYVWPSDITDYIRQLDPQFDSTNVAINSCEGMSPSEKSSWRSFYQSWQDFKKTAYVWFGVPSKIETIRIFEKQLKGWQDTVSTRKCSLPGPSLVTRPDPKDMVDSAKEMAKWVVGAGVVVGGVYLLWPVIVAKMGRRR